MGEFWGGLCGGYHNSPTELWVGGSVYSRTRLADGTSVQFSPILVLTNARRFACGSLKLCAGYSASDSRLSALHW